MTQDQKPKHRVTFLLRDGEPVGMTVESDTPLLPPQAFDLAQAALRADTYEVRDMHTGAHPNASLDLPASMPVPNVPGSSARN